MERLDKQNIEGLLPHRDRALLVERVEIEDGKPIGYYTVTEDICEGHFPGLPVMRNGDRDDMIEQMLGLAASISEGSTMPPGYVGVIVGKGETQYKNPARPGDEVRIQVELTRVTRKIIEGDGVAYVGDKEIANIKGIKALLVSKDKLETS